MINAEDLTRIGSLELRARGIVEGFLQGLHRSPFVGFSFGPVVQTWPVGRLSSDVIQNQSWPKDFVEEVAGAECNACQT